MDFEGHTIKEILVDTEARMKKSMEVIAHEFSTVRTGRATPSLVEIGRASCRERVCLYV